MGGVFAYVLLSGSVASEYMTISDHMRLKCVTREHALLIWAWRNDPMTRRMSRNADVIGWDAHWAWLKKTLSDDRSLFLFAQSDNVGYGVVRFDFVNAGRAEISINLNPNIRGLGIGTIVLRQSCAQALGHFTGELTAEIKRENASSRRIFEKSAFSKSGESENYVYYQMGR